MAINTDRIRERLLYIREQIGTLEHLAHDVDLRRSRMQVPLSYSGIVRNLQTSVEAMIDIAFHLCAK
ncbi:toxin-antitoxin system, antitoxin component, partial [mine drainage metagenome]